MEVLRALANCPPAKHAAVFLFNTGEESGLLGAHSFITQHPWRFSVRAAIDLEAMGVGGRSILFQAGPDGWLLRKFAEVAPYPDGQIVPQHDSLKLYREGSLQHSGDNLVALLRSVTLSDEFEQQRNVSWKTDTKEETPVYVSVGSTMFVLSMASAHRLYQSGIIASLFLLFVAPLFQHALSGKSDAAHPDASQFATWKLGLHMFTALALSLSTVMFTVVGAVSSAAAAAFLVSHPGFSYHSMPYVAHPWLVIGLFAAPALAGGLIAHKAGQVVVFKYLKWIGLCQRGPAIMSEVERLLYKGGVLLWMVILVVADRNSLGSAILAFVLMMAPMLTYLLLEGDGQSWTTNGPRTGLRWCTTVLALAVPLLATSMAAIRLPAFLVGTFTSMDRNPGGAPLFMPSLFISILVALLVSTFLVYLFPYAHRQGATLWLIGFSLFIMATSFFTVHQQILPPLSDTLTRKVNVMHYFDADRSAGFVTFFSLTPGALDEEVKTMNVEGLSCKKDMLIDFVHFNVTYACTKGTDYRAQPFDDSTLRAPKLELVPNGGSSRSSSVRRDDEPMHVFIDAGGSMRWAIAINSDIVANYSLATRSGSVDDENST
ncbi:hypothetical protein CBR_g54226 [Chara braunii]|uniref:Vacuolar membrane protease n=1 Tax=Chara braunii TaxID=69332 RepID=A0A388K7A5_CHABU|nr:hypothetical protein CBR_g54226 [Chara braunii]|eukprot:GBG65932.1 hypothetical protein CBR_g54226 [Chara braunii]